MEIREQSSLGVYSYYVNDELILDVRVVEGGNYEIHENKPNLNIFDNVKPEALIVDMMKQNNYGTINLENDND